MAIIRVSVKRTGTREADASAPVECHLDETASTQQNRQTGDADVFLNTLWLSVLAGAAISLGVAVAAWALSVGLAAVDGAAAIGAIAFALVFVILVTTRLTSAAGGD